MAYLSKRRQNRKTRRVRKQRSIKRRGKRIFRGGDEYEDIELFDFPLFSPNDLLNILRNNAEEIERTDKYFIRELLTRQKNIDINLPILRRPPTPAEIEKARPQIHAFKKTMNRVLESFNYAVDLSILKLFNKYNISISGIINLEEKQIESREAIRMIYNHMFALIYPTSDDFDRLYKEICRGNPSYPSYKYPYYRNPDGKVVMNFLKDNVTQALPPSELFFTEDHMKNIIRVLELVKKDIDDHPDRPLYTDISERIYHNELGRPTILPREGVKLRGVKIEQKTNQNTEREQIKNNVSSMQNTNQNIEQKNNTLFERFFGR
jgi:hypothetical protein